MNKQSKHPTEKGLREKNGKWEYRFKLNGRPYSQVTDLEAVAENINRAQTLRSIKSRASDKGEFPGGAKA